MTVLVFNSPRRIITYAARNAGKISQSGVPSADQFDEWLDRLNDVINTEETQGLKLWVDQDITIASPILTPGLNLYRLGPTGNVVMTKPTRVVLGYYLDVDNNRRPLEPPLAQSQFYMLSTTVEQGAITSYYVDKQQLTLDIYLWLTPDVQACTGQAHFVVQTQIRNMTTLDDTLSFPIEWFNFLQWAMSDQLASGQPQAIMDRCEKKMLFYKDLLENWDVEDASTRFTPDTRNSQNTGRFR